MAQSTQKRVVYRDSVDGQFVKKSYADTHKPTTEKQHVPAPQPAKQPKK
jgi:hypothetical protein